MSRLYNRLNGAGNGRVKIDFPLLAATALQACPDLLCRWLPGGKLQGVEYSAANPTRADRNPGSFKINIQTGVWSDFATGDRGGDLIALFAYLNNLSQFESAKELAHQLGVPIESDDDPVDLTAFLSKLATPNKPPEPACLMPVPDNAPPPPLPIGKPYWGYTSADGEVLGYIVRFDKTGEFNKQGKQKKDFRPLTYWEGQGWQWKSFPRPTPLFGLDQLAQRPMACVVVVEGEQTCIAGRQWFPDFVVVTWPGGSSHAGYADWSVLENRTVCLMPDADQPGIDAMKAIAERLRGCAESVSLATIPAAYEQGWDVANGTWANAEEAFDWFDNLEWTDVFATPEPVEPTPGVRPNLTLISSNVTPITPTVHTLPDADDATVWESTASSGDEDIPEECLTIPFGIGPDLISYLMRTSLHPNRVFAVHTARAFIATVLSRRHVTNKRNFSNLFSLLIGKTASGKEDSKHQLEQLLTACGLARTLAGKGYSHTSAIYSALLAQPKHIAIFDEIGLYLREQRNLQSPIGMVIREFMEIFGRAHGIHAAPQMSGLGQTIAEREAAEKSRPTIQKPSLNVFGMSTPEAFWSSISREHFENGFLNRWLIAESRAPRQPMADFENCEVPQSVIKWVDRVTGKANPVEYAQQFTPDMDPPLIFWSLTPDADVAMKAFEGSMIALADEWDVQQPGLGSLALRANEISLRVALQNAVLEGRPDQALTHEHLVHAQKYVFCHLERSSVTLQRCMVGSVFEGNRNLVLEALRAKGKDGVTLFEMGRVPPFTRFTAKERGELLDSLASGHLIAFLNVRHGKPGVKREAWVALDPDKTAIF